MEQFVPENQAGARVPPSHIESEKSVLGAMMRSRDAAMSAIEGLTEEDFYDPANREIFSAMAYLSANMSAVDITTLDAELTRRGRLEAVGGSAYLVKLSRLVPSATNIKSYIRVVEEKSTLRRLIAAAESILNNCYDGMKETKDVLEEAEKSVYNITMRHGGEQLQPIQPALVDAFAQIEHLFKTHGEMEGVPTGYTELDDILTGMHGGEMILIGGRPSMGKTSIGMNIVENAAIRAGKKAAVFSLEMPAEQLAMRMICTEARVDMSKVKKGQIDPDDWVKLSDAMMLIGPSEIFVDCTPGITVPELRSKARRLQLEKGLDLIMIDYLSLMTGNTRNGGSRQEEVASISRMIKSLALELNIPIIALQQLSRQPAGRSDHRPTLSDIRESGAIEQDADVVMFIHREDYYDKETAEKNVAELLIRKNRNGPLGEVKLGWKPEYTWFMDLSSRPKEALAQA